MKRREFIAAVALGTGGLIALPAWAIWWNSKKVAVESTVFSSLEEEMIRTIADTIIPELDGIGALSVGVDKFLIRLFDQCYPSDVQDNIKLQIEHLIRLSREELGEEIHECDQQTLELLLLSFQNSDDENRRIFFNLMKSETIRGFSTSQVVMEQYLDYNMIPGFYDGCVDVNNSTT